MKNYILKTVMVLILISCGDSGINLDGDKNKTPPKAEVQKGSLSGVIKDDDGSTISNISVNLGTYKSTSQSNGAYLISDIIYGTYNLSITKDRYKSYTKSITINKNSSIENIILIKNTIINIKPDIDLIPPTPVKDGNSDNKLVPPRPSRSS